MKSMRLARTGQTPALIATDVPQPRPQRGRCWFEFTQPASHSRSLPGFRRRTPRTARDEPGPYQPMSSPAKLQSWVTELKDFQLVKEKIYGMNDWFAEGALAETASRNPTGLPLSRERLIMLRRLPYQFGGSHCLARIGRCAKLRAGERVLVHGGAGAVGIFVIQLAHLLDAYVIATASAHNLDFVKELGADEAVD